MEHAERRDGGGWEIRTADGETHEFDALLVCNGHHWDPSYPEFPGQFDGETLHSHHYIDPTEPLDLRGKRVVVVGIGNSGVDIVSELSRKGVAERVFLSTRSGAWVLPKYVFGRPVDQVVRTIPWLPLGCSAGSAGSCSASSPVGWRTSGCRRPTTASSRPTRPSPASCCCGSAPATRVAKPDIEELLGDRVRFADGSVEPVDAIVYATGYRISFPFFDPDFISAPGNVLPLYKRMFKPGIDDLAFVGLGQAIPTIFPFAECQAKLAARWLAGDWALPAQPRWRPRSAATSACTCATTPPASATRCSSTTTSTSTTCASGCCPPGRRGPGGTGLVSCLASVASIADPSADR